MNGNSWRPVDTAVNLKYETLGELSVTLDSIKRFRQIDSKCPGHWRTSSIASGRCSDRVPQSASRPADPRRLLRDPRLRGDDRRA